MFALFLFLTYYFQDVLHYSPIKTGVAFLPMMVAVVVVATLTQSVLVQHLTMRVIAVAGLIISGAGAALLTQADAGSPYAAWVLPGLILVGTGIGSAIVSAVAAGQQGVDPRDAGTAGRGQQRLPAARRGARRRRHQHLRRHRHQPLPDPPRQHRRRRRHRARVHRRLLVGRRPLLGGCGHLRCPDPRRHPAPPGGRPARAPRRDSADCSEHPGCPPTSADFHPTGGTHDPARPRRHASRRPDRHRRLVRPDRQPGRGYANLRYCRT